MASFLAVLPFFAILLYYKNFYEVIFAHATFLFIIILIREMIKDLENLKGDLANGYSTIPIVYGESVSKKIIIVLAISTLIPVYFLVNLFDVGYMDIYFYICLILLILFGVKLSKSNTKEEYNQLHNLLKIIIVAGVFCIILIDPSVLWNGEKLLYRL
jgi:4-hydroxybenzoate polyprenyltransferase